MIIVRLIGGLGNQMFQYALGRTLAERQSTLLKLDLSGFEDYKLHRYGLHCFKTWQHIATADEVLAFRQEDPLSRGAGWILRMKRWLVVRFQASRSDHRDRRVIKENGLGFAPSVLEATGDLYLDGYWQSEKYFAGMRDILLREFAFLHDQDDRNRAVAAQIQSCESVAVHIRRGDYASEPSTNDVHGLCSLDYYRRAVDEVIRRRPGSHFFAFSDDHTWVRQNLAIDHPLTVVDHNDASRNFEDLRLMSSCRHNIIANSSFSWWGAWLNRNPNKLVVAPKDWYRDPTLDTADLIPEPWTRL